MPEILEVEYYRRLAEGALDREIASVMVDEYAGRMVGPGLDPESVFPGLSFTAARRRGKLLLLDTQGPTFGMRFGMTGGLLLDGLVGIEKLEYGPGSYEDKWIRASVTFCDGGVLLLHDPRRLGRVLIDPDEDALGPDAFSITQEEFAASLESRGEGPPIKARLLDQAKIAGIGNLLADEILWRAALSPVRGSATLTAQEVATLHAVTLEVLSELFERGGSHTGDHMVERHVGGHCPLDGHAFFRQHVGGRTTYWCPKHQK